MPDQCMSYGTVGGFRDMKSFGFQVVKGRWFTAFTSLLVMAVTGATYMFGLYSDDIKTSLNYDQTTLNLVSFFKEMGGNVGLLPGLINEVTPPWIVLSIGAVANFFGYFMVWLAVTGRIAKPEIWHMCLYISIGANSQTFANTGNIVTCVNNFPETRGSAIGLLKGYLGLSGAILTQLYHALYGDDSKSLILLLAWLPSLVYFVFLPSIRIIKFVRQDNEFKILYNFLYISLGLAAFLMGTIIIQNIFHFTKIEYIGTASVVTFLLFLPFFTVVNQEIDLWKSKRQALNQISQLKVSTESLIPETFPESASETPEKPVSSMDNIFKPPPRGENYTIWQALMSIDMWLLFITLTCGLGATSTAMDNLGQIGSAQGYPTRSVSTFVSLVSIWNYLGRVASGFASEFLLSKHKIPRPLLLTLVLLFSCVGHLLIAFAIPNSVYFASVIIGFCCGAQWTLISAIISELFGLKYFSTLVNFAGIASPIGSYILNVRVVGNLYDKEALEQMKALGLKREARQGLTCNGVKCYRMAFIIITIATLFGCLVSFVLVLRTNKFYKNDVYKKFKEEKKASEIDTSRIGEVEGRVNGGIATSSN